METTESPSGFIHQYSRKKVIREIVDRSRLVTRELQDRNPAFPELSSSQNRHQAT